ESLEAALEEVRGVRRAVVRAKDAREGRAESLAGYVVLKEGAELKEGQLRDHLEELFPRPFVPGEFVEVAELPRTPSEKVDRDELPAIDERLEPSNRRIAPRNSTEREIAGIWREHLGVEALGVHEAFWQIGGQSLLAVQIRDEIERQFQIDLPMELFWTRSTVAEFADYIEGGSMQRGESRALNSDIVVRLQRGSEGAPVVLVHGVAGRLFEYRSLVEELAGGRPVLGVRSPMVERDGEVAGNLETLAKEYAVELDETAEPGALRVGGWSFGGVLAFELVRQLQRRGRQVECLCIIDAWNPSVVRDRGAGGRITRDVIVDHLARTLGVSAKQFEDDPGELSARSDDALLDRLAEQGEAVGEGAPEGESDLLERLYEIVRAHVRIERTYEPAPLDSTTDVLVLAAEHSTLELEDVDEVRGWGALVGEEQLTCHSFETDHYGMLESPTVTDIAGRFTVDDTSGDDQPQADQASSQSSR
ncbi:MAG: thioesterase domain-containing protein, partial [Bradymonadaceae bacterium]